MRNAYEFYEWKLERAKSMASDPRFSDLSLAWLNEAVRVDYPYMFEWMGVPTIQFPADLFLIQEAIYRSRPSIVIEVGIARGGTTLFIASVMKILDSRIRTKVIGVDLSVSSHTLKAIQESELSELVALVEGNSVDKNILSKIRGLISPMDRVLVILDSNHSMDHVYQEILEYQEFITSGSFLIVMDTAIDYISQDLIPADKGWHSGNSPLTAANKYMNLHPGKFELDMELNNRSFPGASRGGFMRKI